MLNVPSLLTQSVSLKSMEDYKKFGFRVANIASKAGAALIFHLSHKALQSSCKCSAHILLLFCARCTFDLHTLVL